MCFHVSSPLSILPSVFKEMLECFFKDLFPKDIPRGLPPIKGIEHHINFTLGPTLPNKIAYRANLEESREIQQVGWIQESKSSCVIRVSLVLKKDRSSDFYKTDLQNKYH
ncbi:hypothetical protein CR513_16272, partial [Mucuna pruriens]